ncbi:calcineurin-like phosphoesterase C-terminal domain-containing protein [Gemmatimonadota bacterium]
MNPIRTGLAGSALLLTIAGLTVSLTSCGDEPVPLPEYPEGTARGVVFEDVNGNGIRDEGEAGIPGVGVSDQRMVTVTDRDGRWSLPAHRKGVYFVSKPRGYMTPVSEDNIPRFYYLHNEGEPLDLEGPVIPTTGPLPASIDFPLRRRAEPDRFQAIFMGDPQPRDQMEVDFLAHDVLEELIGTTAAFAVTLGDITFDRPDLYASVTLATGVLGIPFYNTHGNHDANYDGRDTYDHFETWRTVFGPRYYSFDYGPVHFVILSDVLFPDGGTSYIPGLGQEQLEWLEADLSHVPVDRLVVLAMHIPLRPAETVPDFARLYELLRDRPHTLSLSAHSHDLTQAFLPEDWGWSGVAPHYHINAGATCGSWWEGARDETDIPHATSSDGSPNGYFIVSFDGNQHTARFKAARRPADHQMQIQAPDSVAQRDLADTPVLVNVFSASPGSTVEMRVGDSGEWVGMDFAPQPDPLFVRVAERESGRRASVSFHIWEGRLPAGLTPGGHLIRVRTTDRYGQEFVGSRIIRVVNDLP